MLSVLFIIIIYLFTTFFSAACPFFKGIMDREAVEKLLGLVSKGFLSVYLYIYSSLHLSCCYLVKQTHEALMRSKPDMYF